MKSLLLGILSASVLASAALATGDRIVLATGLLVRGATTYQNAVVTYNPVMDASGLGSNPGIELWPNPAAEAAGVGRLCRSNDNNGQWNYAPVGAFFGNGKVFVYGTKTGSHGPVTNVWSGGQDMFLLQTPAVRDIAPTILADTRELYGPFKLVRGGITYPEAYVSYDPAMDASGLGSNPGIEVWPTLSGAIARTDRVMRSNDNNGQWNYRVDAVYSFGGNLYILGGRSPGSAIMTPRVWTTWGATSFFLLGSDGFQF